MDAITSIPGIGLKTACTLLRRWKSAEQVVRAIMLEGKNFVPPGYCKQFQLAEKCFLNQRVTGTTTEDEYISPTPFEDLQNLSSPLRPGQTPARQKWKSDQRQQMDDSGMVYSDGLDEEGAEQVRANPSRTKVVMN